MENQAWDISCTREVFDKIKSDESFLGLLTLARFTNALRFCQRAGIDAKGETNLLSAQSSINSFLFASSVLFEGFLLVEKLAKHYRDRDSFKNGFGGLLRDRDISSLRNSVLKRARNKFVFHFDQDVAKEALQNFDLPTIKFASGVGTARGEMYFGIADELVVNYLLQPKKNESNESLTLRFTEIVKRTTKLMEEFSQSAETLMADVLKTIGFSVVRGR